MQKKNSWIGVLSLILLACFMLGSCSSGSSSSSHSTKTCGSCHRTYEAGDAGGNFSSISRRGLCKKCYNNCKSFGKC